MASDLIWIRVDRDGEIRDEQIQGHVIVPGLAVTRVVDRPGEWSVTHVGSGERLSSYGSMCRPCAESVARHGAGVDWTRPKSELIESPTVVAFIWRVDRGVELCTGSCS